MIAAMWANAFRDVECVGQTGTQIVEAYHHVLKFHRIFKTTQLRYVRVINLVETLLHQVLPDIMVKFHVRQAGECNKCLWNMNRLRPVLAKCTQCCGS